MTRNLAAILIGLAISSMPSVGRPQSIVIRPADQIATATSSGPKPWLLDLDTRLQQRFDQNLRSARLKAAALTSTPGIAPLTTSPDADVIDGSKHPELLLPWELHRFLLSTAFYDEPEVAKAWRARFAKAAPDLGIDDAFWSTLESVSSEYLSDQRQIHYSSDQMPRASQAEQKRIQRSVVVKESVQCLRRFVALEQATQRLGRERFYEFLYRSVAPNITISAVTPTPAEKLRYVAGGCR